MTKKSLIDSITSRLALWVTLIGMILTGGNAIYTEKEKIALMSMRIDVLEQKISTFDSVHIQLVAIETKLAHIQSSLVDLQQQLNNTN